MTPPRILGCPCLDGSGIHEHIRELVSRKRGGYSVAVNAEKIMMYNRDPVIRALIDGAVLPVPDGSGAVLGFRWLNRRKVSKIDLPRTVMELSDANRYRLFLLGTDEATNEKAFSAVQTAYPGIIVTGRRNGFFKDALPVLETIRAANPQIVLVALGSPKQELFSADASRRLPGILFIGCGGALDVLGGRARRAPAFFVHHHLEWLYRLVKQPLRIRRQKVLPLFMTKLLWETVKLRLARCFK